MRCFSPIRVELPKPRFNKVTLKHEYYAEVPCGRCVACKERIRLSWFVRLLEEQKDSSSAWFITLTYDEAFVPFHTDEVYGICYNFDKPEIQKFLKRFRKYDGSNNVRYYLIAEYGGKTYRPHYHLHLFNAVGTKEQVILNIKRAWPYGRVSIGDFNDARANYVAGHIQYRDDVPPGYERPWVLMSRRPGIGASGLKRLKKTFSKDDVVRLYSWNNKFLSMPRYYQERLYDKYHNDSRSEYLKQKQKPIPNEHLLQRQFISKVNKRKKLRIDNPNI